MSTAVKFTKDHEWIKMDGEIAIVGITNFAQQQLGDVVFVDLPALGKKVSAGGDAAVVESVKAASDVYAPIDGEIVGVNQAIADEPGLVNQDPEGNAWFFKIKPSNPSQLDGLMDAASYATHIGA